MFFFSFFNLRKGDTLLLVTNPALSIPFFSFLRRIRKFRFLILVHDVFPENLIPAKIIRSKTNPIYKFLKLIFDWSYKKADQLFVLGRDMKEVLLHKVKDENKISIIENWADLDNVNVSDFEDNQIIKEHQLQNKIVFLFAGNLGRVQGLDYFFELISSLDNGLLHFLFVGEGTMLSNLMQIKTEKKLDNVSFLGTYPRSKQSLFLNAAHFGVVTLEEEVYGLGVPSKSYNILAAGKPLFFIGNQASEIAQLIKEFSCGVSFGNEQKEETIAFFNKLNLDNIVVYKEMGVVGKKVAECKYSKDMILSKFKKAIINEDS
jgi:glycosyltransferase involved in cell wall biosynthesis